LVFIYIFSVKELDIESMRTNIKKSQSTGDNLSDGSNASNSNYSYTVNKSKSPFRKKELSPRLLQDWDKIDDNIDEFDLFQFENIEEIAQNEQNKYQGLHGFAKIIEKDEKKERLSLKKKNFGNYKPKILPENIMKIENFDEMYPPKSFSRSHSKEKRDKSLKIKRKSSETSLPINETLNFLDKMLKNSKMTLIQESKLKSVFLKISSQADLKKEVKKFGPWGDIWEDKEQAIRQGSPYAHFNSYKLRPIIVKGGDDLRQEVLAMQIMRKLKEMFKKEKIMAYLRPYEVIVTNANSGIIGIFIVILIF